MIRRAVAAAILPYRSPAVEKRALWADHKPAHPIRVVSLLFAAGREVAS
jgi:hypothetical protein